MCECHTRYFFYNKKSISVFSFPINAVIFLIKGGKVGIFRWLCSVFPSKLPIFWYISEVSFDRKCIKIIDILIFFNKKSDSVFRFSVKQPNIRKNRVKMSIWVNFWIKGMKRVVVRKLVYRNSSFTTVTEKWKVSLDVFSFQ